MSHMDIKQWEDKMKESRKNTPFRDFLKDVVSLRNLGFYRNGTYTSIFPKSDRVKGVISHKQYEENRDDLIKNGLDYQFDKNFFENFKTLFRSIEMSPTLLFGDCDNANFSDQTVDSGNSYLSYVIIKDCQNVLYSLSVKENSTNIINSLMVWDNCENIYFAKGVINSFNIFYSKYITNSSNVRFSTNLTGCHDCLFCFDLQNQSYCIENKQYAKEEYLEKKQELLKDKSKFDQYYASLDNIGKNIASDDVDGVANIQCENIDKGYYNYQIKEGKNIVLIGGKGVGERVYDCFLNTPPLNDFYGVFSAGFGSNVYNSYHIRGGSNIYYSAILDRCTYCLGCVGLKNKQYCILNKQYTKEERFKLANQIFQQMEWDGILGKSLPGWTNPFYFNDTVAYLIDDSFTKEEVEKEGFLWRDEDIKVDIPEGSEVVVIKDLGQYEGFDSEGKWQINPEIMKKVIRDDKGNYYRIIKLEYDFLVKNGLPLPRLHWLDRLKMNFKLGK